MAERDMVSVPGGRICVGLTTEEADRLARVLVDMELEYRATAAPSLGFEPDPDPDLIYLQRRASLQVSVPAHDVDIAPFRIDRLPVTNAEWERYLRDTGQPPHEDRRRTRPSWPEEFVVRVSWRDAKRYAEYCGLDLPTEAEWERAARNGRSFWPWGDDYFPLGRQAYEPVAMVPYPVGSKPDLRSWCGVEDLIGSFGEHCLDAFGPHPGASEADFDLLYEEWRGMRAVRGGYTVFQDSTCVFRSGHDESRASGTIKLRLVERTVSPDWVASGWPGDARSGHPVLKVENLAQVCQRSTAEGSAQAWAVFDRIRAKVRQIDEWEGELTPPPYRDLPPLYEELASCGEAGLQLILASLEHGDAVARKEAAHAAAALPEALFARAVPALQHAATGPDARAAALTLAGRSLPALRASGAHLSGDEVVTGALMRDERGFPLLAEALRSERGAVRKSAVNRVSLSNSRPMLEAVKPELLQLLRDQEHGIRLEAVRCLYKLDGDAEVQRALIDAAAQEIDLLVPGAAKQVASHPDAGVLLEPLARASLTEEHPVTAFWCIRPIAAALDLDRARAACTPVMREALLRILNRKPTRDPYDRPPRTFAAAARAAGALRDRDLVVTVLEQSRSFRGSTLIQDAVKDALRNWSGPAQAELERLAADESAPEEDRAQARRILGSIPTR